MGKDRVTFTFTFRVMVRGAVRVKFMVTGGFRVRVMGRIKV